MSDDTKALAPKIPAKLVRSIAALRALASEVKSLDEWKRVGRYATPEEIAASEALRLPHHCVGHSTRHGLACTKSRILGATVCKVHGGSLTRTKKAAANRLREATMPVLNSLIDTAMQRENLNAQVKAAQHVLNAAGVGAEVEAKIRSSKRDSGGSRIQVHIGFLSTTTDGAPVTIDVPKVGVVEE